MKKTEWGKCSMSVLAKITIGMLLFAGGCQKDYIPNTEILKTDFNQDVIDFCERYRKAVEDLNVGVLMSLASPRYLDNNGTPSGDDDIDYAKLEEVLHQRFDNISDIRFEIKYRDLFVQDSVIWVQYTFTMSFQYEVEGKTKWHNHTGDQRLELEMADDGFLIVSGM